MYILYTPSNIKDINIASNAFSGCDYLVEVIYDTTMPSNLNISARSTHKLTYQNNEIVKYTNYDENYVWWTESEENPTLLKVCDAKETVILPDNYNGNGYSIYSNVINSEIVKKIVVPSSVTYIEYMAFIVPNIEEIDLPFTGFSASEEDIGASMLLIFGAGEEVVLTEYDGFILYRPLGLKKVILHSAEKEYSFYKLDKESLEIVIE